MNFKQKIACILGICAIVYLCITVDVGEPTKKLVVKYDDRLVEYVCKDFKEAEDLLLKSKNEVLFFDGEYFYEEPPTHDRNKTRATIVKEERAVIKGDISPSEFFLMMVATLAVVGALFVGFYEGDEYSGYIG
jgi:hypothetical protein